MLTILGVLDVFGLKFIISKLMCDCRRSSFVIRDMTEFAPSLSAGSKISGCVGCSIGSPERGTGAGRL